MKTLIIGFALSALGMAAQAYEFEFTGRVTYTDQSLSGVANGTVFQGRFSAQGPQLSSYTPGKIASYDFSSGSVTAIIAGHAITAGNPSIRIYNDLGSNVEDGFSMSSGYTLTIDGTTYSDGVFGFNLTTQPGNTGVISGLSLPAQLNVPSFDGHSSLTYGFMQRDGGPTGSILGFEVLSVSMVPEPDMVWLIGAGLLSAALVRRKRFTA